MPLLDSSLCSIAAMALQQPSALAWVSKLGEEKEGVGKRLYLMTFSRLLLDTSDAANADLRDLATLSQSKWESLSRKHSMTRCNRKVAAVVPLPMQEALSVQSAAQVQLGRQCSNSGSTTQTDMNYFQSPMPCADEVFAQVWLVELPELVVRTRLPTCVLALIGLGVAYLVRPKWTFGSIGSAPS